jgi:hypothetical protein
MHIYRCFFLDAADHIKAAEIIEAEAIGEVIETAQTLLRERHKHRAVEIWEGSQRLYRTEVSRTVE